MSAIDLNYLSVHIMHCFVVNYLSKIAQQFYNNGDKEGFNYNSQLIAPIDIMHAYKTKHKKSESECPYPSSRFAFDHLDGESWQPQ